MHTDRVLSSIDWAVFRARVHGCVLDAFARYGEPGPGDSAREPVYQLGLWTDGRALFTGVSLETRTHALVAIQSSVRYFAERGLHDVAEQIRALEYNTNPADFQYHSFGGTEHPELRPVCDLEYEPEINEQIDRATEAHLWQVVRELDAGGSLLRIPREQTVWVGVSSARDWYDNVTAF